jgi:hypothetical protein
MVTFVTIILVIRQEIHECEMCKSYFEKSVIAKPRLKHFYGWTKYEIYRIHFRKSDKYLMFRYSETLYAKGLCPFTHPHRRNYVPAGHLSF